MKLLTLFLTFFKIGAISFGGGYGMLSVIRDTVLSNNWLTETEILNFIAVSETTPGPIAVNMATFIGSSQAGILGSLMATLGVILPSFIIILFIVKYIKDILKKKSVTNILAGIKPCVVALILTTSLTMFLTTIFSFTTIKDKLAFDLSGLIIFLILVTTHLIITKVFKKTPSPILMILFSAGLGLLFYI